MCLKQFYILILLLLISTACTTLNQPADSIDSINLAAKIAPGMTYTDVKNIMGAPVKIESVDSKQAWHYCRTGNTSDQFVALIFNDEKVFEINVYTVPFGGGTWLEDCSRYIRTAFK